MKPIKNERTTKTFKLPGGSSENDLPVEPWDAEAGTRVHTSFWVPSEGELIQLEDGATISLSVWGLVHPPVALGIGPEANAESILAADDEAAKVWPPEAVAAQHRQIRAAIETAVGELRGGPLSMLGLKRLADGLQELLDGNAALAVERQAHPDWPAAPPHSVDVTPEDDGPRDDSTAEFVADDFEVAAVGETPTTLGELAQLHRAMNGRPFARLVVLVPSGEVYPVPQVEAGQTVSREREVG